MENKKMKTRYKNILNLSLSAVTALLLAGCGSDSDSDTNTSSTQTVAISKNVEIKFLAKVGDEILKCSEDGKAKKYNRIGITGDDNITIKDFRFFVSEFSLVDRDGKVHEINLSNNDYQYNDINHSESVAMLDFEDRTGDCNESENNSATYTKVIGKVTEGNWSKIRFTLGVPLWLNHHNLPDIEALNHSKMHWNWATGRKFTKFETKPDSNRSMTWYFHLGSTGCVDDNMSGVVTCAQPNRIDIELPFDSISQTVVIDYAKILEDSDMSLDLGGAKGCMSSLTDPECKDMFKNIGLDVNKKDGISSNQDIFYVQ